MPIDPVSEEALREVIEAREKHVSGHEAARSLGLPESTFRQRLKIAAKRGLYQPAGVPPGFEIAKLSETRDANDNIRSRSVQIASTTRSWGQPTATLQKRTICR